MEKSLFAAPLFNDAKLLLFRRLLVATLVTNSRVRLTSRPRTNALAFPRALVAPRTRERLYGHPRKGSVEREA